MEELNEKVAVEEEKTEAVVEENAQTNIPVVETNEEINTLEAVQASGEEASTVEELPKKELPIKKILIAAIALIAVVAVAVIVVLNIKSSNIEKKILELSDKGKFEEAYSMLLDNKKHKNYDDIEESIFEEHSKEVNSLIEKEKYKEAGELLNEITDSSEFDSLSEDLYESHEEKVYELMDKGEYEDAFELLCEVTDNPKFDEINKTIIAECWILKGALDLRQYYKNPNSMQINRVDIYDQEGSTDYPFLVMSTSGQNGFGGYASSYSIFDDDDLECLGSTSTLNPDSDDDLEDRLCALLIKTIEDNPKVEYPFDLNRVNRILSQNITADLHIEKYASSKASKA